MLLCEHFVLYRHPVILPISKSQEVIRIIKEPLEYLRKMLDELRQESTTYEATWKSYQYSLALEKVIYVNIVP